MLHAFRVWKMLVRIANREDPDQIASSEAIDPGLHCLSWPHLQATGVQDFITFTVLCMLGNFSSF